MTHDQLPDGFEDDLNIISVLKSWALAPRTAIIHTNHRQSMRALKGEHTLWSIAVLNPDVFVFETPWVAEFAPYSICELFLTVE